MFAYLGLYPVAGTPSYALGSPFFADVNVTVPGAAAGAPAVLRVIAHNITDAASVFVARVTANGACVPTPFINHTDLFAPNAVLEFWLTDTSSPWQTCS